MDMRLNHFAAILDVVAVQTAATTVEREEGVEERERERARGRGWQHFALPFPAIIVLCVSGST